jgi:hypothetical protein
MLELDPKKYGARLAPILGGRTEVVCRLMR